MHPDGSPFRNGPLAALADVEEITSQWAPPRPTSSGGGSPFRLCLPSGKPALGPLSSATLISGRSFTAADADADVAVVDSGYATSQDLKTGSALTIDGIKFTVIGVVRQAQASRPPDVYVPLARAQAMSLYAGSLNGGVTTIYVAAASASDIPSVSKEISRLLPGSTVTTEASLASE